MRGSSIRQLSDQDALRLYEWAESNPAAVLKCTCQHVRSIRTIPELSYALGGQTLFLHYETPALVAEVCGIVVGVTPKEEQVSYEVDDGTSVLRIVETRKSLRHAESRSALPGATAIVPSGVPDCYIMPPQPKPSSSSSRTDNAAPPVFLAPLIPRFKVADIVSCTGKIHVDRDGHKFLFAQQMGRCDDINMESRHRIDVIKLETEVYRRPFDWNRVGPDKQQTFAEHRTVHKSIPQTSARSLVSDSSPNEKARPAPTLSAHPEPQESVEKQRLPADQARRLISGNASLSIPSTGFATSSCSSRESSEPTIRKLRAHDKIPDRHLTESYFQLQLQQHISQHHRSQPFALSHLLSDTTLSSLAQRLVSILLQRRRLTSRSADTTEQHPQKVRRLFEWAIRKMMQDGFIVLAEVEDSKFLGLTQSVDAGSTDAYRLVTPEYLLLPLTKLLGSNTLSSPSHLVEQDADQLTARLRTLDDRFRNISPSLVQESLTLYRVRRAPIVIE